ncbi:hypothetical protein Fcan01_14408 [Folsomia candida]|uniref:Uncharacterized protein n=1 Tax=Folsomia candida TaxID=158441 RepID=A0A226E144_FOLCA|nr:hypothetical protein Fcan01_14408 [Folsomia candida]
MILTNWLLYFWILQTGILQVNAIKHFSYLNLLSISFKACICPNEWKYGLPAKICGKEITAINGDKTCKPQAVYNCTELGGVGTIPPRMDCSNHNFCEMIFTRACRTEECCKDQRRKRGCIDLVNYKYRHQTLGKPDQPNPVSPSQYPAVRENVFEACLKDYPENALRVYGTKAQNLSIFFKACICPKEWKYGLPARICGKEITAINNDNSCEPQFIYDCIELGGVATISVEKNCSESGHEFCEMFSSQGCRTEEYCKEERRKRRCTNVVQTLQNRHLTLGKRGQPNPVSPSQYPAVRENVFEACLKDYPENSQRVLAFARKSGNLDGQAASAARKSQPSLMIIHVNLNLSTIAQNLGELRFPFGGTVLRPRTNSVKFIYLESATLKNAAEKNDA